LQQIEKKGRFTTEKRRKVQLELYNRLNITTAMNYRLAVVISFSLSFFFVVEKG